ncbi:MAG: hypothetical protein K8R85_10025 [Bacteroidetes bacterium]|nr:hypothetical protein [Bacteroidota bacterium]
MKKIAVIFFLFVFLFNTMGYFIAFKAVHYQIKKEIKAEIKRKVNPSELTVIVINKKRINQIDWLENGKEMYHDGKLYDIVRNTENDTSIIYYCINDKQEEELFAHLEEHINAHIAANKPIRNKSTKKLADNIIKLYFSNKTSHSFNSDSNIITQFPGVYFTYVSPTLKRNSPPPEFS